MSFVPKTLLITMLLLVVLHISELYSSASVHNLNLFHNFGEEEGCVPVHGKIAMVMFITRCGIHEQKQTLARLFCS